MLRAYTSQFKKDFSLFLKSRAVETVPGGRMFLSFISSDFDPTTLQSCFKWELLAQALTSLASEGLVEEEKLDSFNVPYYAPNPEEVKCIVQDDGSFLIDRLESFKLYWEDTMETEFEELSSGQRAAKSIKGGGVGSMLECHFGREIMDVLFRRYGEMVDDHLSRERVAYVLLVVSLIRVE